MVSLQNVTPIIDRRQQEGYLRRTLIGEIREISVNYNNYLNRDYKSEEAKTGQPSRRLRRHHLHILAFSSIALGLLALVTPGDEASATRQLASENTPYLVGDEHLLRLPLNLPASATTQTAAELPQSLPEKHWQKVSVKSGDSLSKIFDRLDLDQQQLLAVVSADNEKRLRQLHPGQKLHFHIEDGQLQALDYRISATKNLLIQRHNSEFRAELSDKTLDTRLAHASATITSSLFEAGQRAGLSDNLIMELANIFGWDVDFALDIRSGDHFSLLYEEHYLDGEKLRDGQILAAEFTNRGTAYKAVRFTDPNGESQYYSEDGKSMRKAFLRSPVDFRRISSKFARERFHPVLGKKRPHKGVDYAAATGTPIKAAGDGKVIFRGTKGGYGRTVMLQHGGKYTTLYAHLSKYRRGVLNGTRVKQGQVIGYVGKSGLATGPHLHYEFRVNGVHRNPLTVKFPDATPVAKKHHAQFLQQSQQLLAQLALFQQVRVAAN